MSTVINGIRVPQPGDPWDVPGDLARFAQDLAASSGGGGGGLTPDPDHPGFYLPSGSGLTPDPDHPGFYLIGA